LEFKELVRERRTIRKFLPEPITEDTVKEIIATATCACNSGNQQNWRFIVIQNDLVKERMAQIVRAKARYLVEEAEKAGATNNTPYDPPQFYREAPVVIGVVATGKYQTKPDLLMLDMGYRETMIADLRCRGDMQTIGAVTQLLLLAAWEKGLGGCWMTGPLFSRTGLEEFFEIMEGESLAALIPLGKPAIMPPRSGRKAVDEIVRFIK